MQKRKLHNSRGAVKISTKEKEPIYYLFGANRYTSNASNIAIGYQTNDKSFIFLRECFADIYSKNPTLTARDIIMVDSIWSDENQLKRFCDCIYDENITILPEDIIQFKNILEQINGYEPAFSEENFKQLILKKNK